MGFVGRRFRFGYQLGEDDDRDPVAAACAAEAAGFDVVLVSDHVGPGVSPMVTLGAIAQATAQIRLGTLVLNHDMRNPVQLAWEAVTIDRLSQGRFVLGLGAGHTPREYSATGTVTRSTGALIGWIPRSNKYAPVRANDFMTSSSTRWYR